MGTELAADVLSELRFVAGGEARDAARVSSLPAEPGAYLLLLRLRAELTLHIRTLPPTRLPAGWYLYAGSARGPGGIRARVGRHLRRDKRPHWHVDHLTDAAASVRPIAVPGGCECALVRALLTRRAFAPAVPGFGSSDCRVCPSHLLAIDRQGD